MSKDDNFFDDTGFSDMLPSKTKMAVLGIGVVLLNVTLFLGAVGVIAYAVKWVVSSQ